MDLDDQLAALAAGELAPDEARALQARVAVDPALQRRLTRLEQLDEVLRGWRVPGMDDGAVSRLDAAVSEALDALPDTPLADADSRTPVLLPLRDEPDERDRPVPAAAAAASPAGASPAGATDDVVDLAAERERRRTPAWVPRVGVAAALLLVVGVGVGPLLSGSDREDAAQDTVASFDDADESAEETAEAPMAQELPESDAADDAGDAMMSAPAEDAAGGSTAVAVRTDLDLAGGDLVALAREASPLARTNGETTATTEQDEEASTEDGEGRDGEQATPAHTACVDLALELAGGGRVLLVGTGTYDGTAASFVVVTPDDPDAAPVAFAFASDADCALLGRGAADG